MKGRLAAGLVAILGATLALACALPADAQPGGARTTPSESVGSYGAGTNGARISAAIGTSYLPAEFAWGYSDTAPDVEIPDDPVTTTTRDVDSERELVAALGGNGRLITVAAGRYSGLSIDEARTDLDIVLDDDAIFSNGINIGGRGNPTIRRIRITGGSFDGYFITGSNVSSILLDNIRASHGGEVSPFNGVPRQVAIINSTPHTDISADNYGLLHVMDHAVIANNKFETTAGSSPVRGTGQHIIFARNCMMSGGHRAQRIHAETNRDTTDVLLTNNMYVGPDEVWIGPFQGVALTTAIRRVQIHYNQYYNNKAGRGGEGWIQSDADQGAGIDGFVVSNNDAHSPDRQVTTPRGIRNYSDLGRNTFAPYSTPPACTAGASR